MTSAEEMNRAAALMRERAEKATPRPWQADHADATFDAGVPPLAALAVADLLEEVAADRHACLDAWVERAALKVARAYLDEARETTQTGETQ